jgi:hypothetical protein
MPCGAPSVGSDFDGTPRPGSPYPLLAISGEQGSAKTVLSKMLKALVDPNADPCASAAKPRLVAPDRPSGRQVPEDQLRQLVRAVRVGRARRQVQPASPSRPCGPMAPDGPGGPAAPRSPTGRWGPTGPCGPCAPRGPAGPIGPGGPACPRGPRRTLRPRLTTAPRQCKERDSGRHAQQAAHRYSPREDTKDAPRLHPR